MLRLHVIRHHFMREIKGIYLMHANKRRAKKIIEQMKFNKDRCELIENWHNASRSEGKKDKHVIKLL